MEPDRRGTGRTEMEPDRQTGRRWSLTDKKGEDGAWQTGREEMEPGRHLPSNTAGPVAFTLPQPLQEPGG